MLVDDLLLLAHLDEGRPLERSRSSSTDVVGEAVETARTVEPDRPIAVELEQATVDRRPRPAAPGRRQPARQRPRPHAGPGRRCASTSAASTATRSSSVADSGPGLDEEQTSHVFERFYRADPSRARASGGVGLGLAIVAAVAHAHGGTVSARSAPGEGATFSIELPLAENGAGDTPPPVGPR